MHPRIVLTFTALLILPNATALAADPPQPADNVAGLLEAHDRSLVRDLTTYIEKHRDAEDLDQAYLEPFRACHRA